MPPALNLVDTKILSQALSGSSVFPLGDSHLADLSFLFLLPKVTLLAREGPGSLGSARQALGQGGTTHLEAQQDTQVPRWHVLNLVQHVEFGLRGHGHLWVLGGVSC